MADSKSDSIIDGHFATNPAVIPLESGLAEHLDNALWQYACQVYSKAGVEAALLTLQDEQGADINLILQALWLASEGVEWTPAYIPNDYGKWVEEQVIPIRTMRRSLKTDWVELRGEGYEDFRQQVKTLELKAEQYALAMLYQQSIACSFNVESDKQTNVHKETVTLTNNLCSFVEHFALEPAVVLGLLKIVID